MTPQEAIDRAIQRAANAETILLNVRNGPTQRSTAMPEAQIEATLAEAYARIASAQVVMQTSAAAQEAQRLEAMAGLPGARA